MSQRPFPPCAALSCVKPPQGSLYLILPHPRHPSQSEEGFVHPDVPPSSAPAPPYWSQLCPKLQLFPATSCLTPAPTPIPHSTPYSSSCPLFCTLDLFPCLKLQPVFSNSFPTCVHPSLAPISDTFPCFHHRCFSFCFSEDSAALAMTLARETRGEATYVKSDKELAVVVGTQEPWFVPFFPQIHYFPVTLAPGLPTCGSQDPAAPRNPGTQSFPNSLPHCPTPQKTQMPELLPPMAQT